MLDQGTHQATEAIAALDGETVDLVVIGAGVAGLNALYAASEYLPKGARVLLVDQKDAPGGMWNTAYDYVRLHQPHPMFTVGDMTWDWRKPRDYLAARNEVQAHLSRALTPVGQKVDLQTAFGQTMTRCAERQTSHGPRVEVTFQPNADPDRQTTVMAHRAIHASGLNYVVAAPLKLSSSAVVSIIPQALRATLAAHPGAPVVVVGGGKTGMDTVLATLATGPDREVRLIKGPGTNFLNRSKYLPTGLARWTSGALGSRLFRDLALAYDGDNEAETMAHFRKHHATDPSTENGVFLYGLQSEEELARIRSGLTETRADYLQDVTDGVDGPQMVLRSGAIEPIAEGSIVVNCTGSFFRSETMGDMEPLLSDSGTILRINARDSFHFLTSVAAFFATHLLFRDQLRGQGFYRLDHEGLFRQNRNAWVGASAAQAYLNQVRAVQVLPMMLLDRCGLDLDRWYPLPRRLAGLWKMKASAKADIAHCRAVLDRVATRFDVIASPLD